MQPKEIFKSLNINLFLTYMPLIVNLSLYSGTKYWYNTSTHWTYFKNHLPTPNYQYMKNLMVIFILTKQSWPPRHRSSLEHPPLQQETYGNYTGDICVTLVPKRNITNVSSFISSTIMTFALPIIIHCIPKIVTLWLSPTQLALSKHHRTSYSPGKVRIISSPSIWKNTKPWHWNNDLRSSKNTPHR